MYVKNEEIYKRGTTGCGVKDKLLNNHSIQRIINQITHEFSIRSVHDYTVNLTDKLYLIKQFQGTLIKRLLNEIKLTVTHKNYMPELPNIRSTRCGIMLRLKLRMQDVCDGFLNINALPLLGPTPPKSQISKVFTSIY